MSIVDSMRPRSRTQEQRAELRARAIQGNPQFYTAADRAWSDAILAAIPAASLPEAVPPTVAPAPDPVQAPKQDTVGARVAHVDVAPPAEPEPEIRVTDDGAVAEPEQASGVDAEGEDEHHEAT